MANDINNMSAGVSGEQLLGSVTVGLGNGAVSRNSNDYAIGEAGHNGSFGESHTIAMSTLVSKYDATFVTTKAATATTTELADVSDDINVLNKKAGRTVFNTSTNKTVFAGGSAVADHWYISDGTDTHTPT